MLNLEKYYPIEIDNNYHEGHGHILSIKIVMPTYCQANCDFCFNKLTQNTQQHNKILFKDNIIKTLDEIFSTIKNRKISLDITGGEPTFDPIFFKEIMDILKVYKTNYKNIIDKIVLTTNGYKLYDCLKSMIGVVDIVNISLHQSNYNDRVSIFKTKLIPTDYDLKFINNHLKENGIKITGVFVINSVCYMECLFKYIVEKYANFGKIVGFDDIRIRIDFTTQNILLKKLFDVKFDDEVVFYKKGLNSKFIKINNYPVNIYSGVPSLIDYVIGVEMVIDDDGKLYLDYNKEYPLNNDDLHIIDKNIFIHYN